MLVAVQTISRVRKKDRGWIFFLWEPGVRRLCSHSWSDFSGHWVSNWTGYLVKAVANWPTALYVITGGRDTKWVNKRRSCKTFRSREASFVLNYTLSSMCSSFFFFRSFFHFDSWQNYSSRPLIWGFLTNQRLQRRKDGLLKVPLSCGTLSDWGFIYLRLKSSHSGIASLDNYKSRL